VRPQRTRLLDLDGRDDEGEEPISHSILGLDRASGRKGPPAATPAAANPPSPFESVEVPEFERDLEDRLRRPIPLERAVLFSLAAHLLFLLLIMLAPAGSLSQAGRGLFGALVAPEDTSEKIPIVFREAPGPARENPRRAEPSDKTRRAGGGDPARARSDSPYIPPRPGPEGLRPGAAEPSQPASRGPMPSAGADRTAAAAPGERSKGGPDSFQVPPSGAAASSQESARLSGLDRAIRDAAKAVGAEGEGGAGTPNPEGGFVDSGPISFDTSWYDWGPYAEEMVRRIKLHWEIPELARLGWKGRLTVRFFILANGTVEGARIISRSGIPPFDFAALQSILKSDPFRPLPKDLLAQVPGKDREGITVTFFYNLRPGHENDSEGPPKPNPR
jgi:TonB family protein